mmetsp:Transcript_17059/g.48763  ORF Transcript_17059/g.48763 Transcript_17059/m.48763 type:complete len:272 (+) Transcript_17059:1098-1913(+)
MDLGQQLAHLLRLPLRLCPRPAVRLEVPALALGEERRRQVSRGEQLDGIHESRLDENRWQGLCKAPEYPWCVAVHDEALAISPLYFEGSVILLMRASNLLHLQDLLAALAEDRLRREALHSLKPLLISLLAAAHEEVHRPRHVYGLAGAQDLPHGLHGLHERGLLELRHALRVGEHVELWAALHDQLHPFVALLRPLRQHRPALAQAVERLLLQVGGRAEIHERRRAPPLRSQAGPARPRGLPVRREERLGGGDHLGGHEGAVAEELRRRL